MLWTEQSSRWEWDAEVRRGDEVKWIENWSPQPSQPAARIHKPHVQVPQVQQMEVQEVKFEFQINSE